MKHHEEIPVQRMWQALNIEKRNIVVWFCVLIFNIQEANRLKETMQPGKQTSTTQKAVYYMS